MDITSSFQKHFGCNPTIQARAPGRVNLLGEHTDYNDGPVLPVAIDRYINLAAAPGIDGHVSIFAVDLNEHVKFNLHGLAEKVDTIGKPLPQWALYPAGVAYSLLEASLHLSGLQAAFSSNIPMGAGLSSSAAIEVGFAILWQTLGKWEVKPMQMAQICQRAENDYVGLACGLMDQFASLFGIPGHALYLDTRSLEWEAIPLPAETAIVVADSNIRHNLASSGYNQRRASCEEAVRLLQKYMPKIQALRDVPLTEFAAYSYYLPNETRKRAEHVVKEIARVDSAVNALHRDDKRAFGALMFAGHRSLRDLYEVSVPELDILVDLAHQLDGCIGARMTGGGFGGSTVNLVEVEHAEKFIQALIDGYSKETGLETQVYLCEASQGARIII